MPPPAEHFDDFFREQLRQLQAEGHAPEEAADILLQAQGAILRACQRVLEFCENGEPLTDQEVPGGVEVDPGQQS
jgi:hypothetical protein